MRPARWPASLRARLTLWYTLVLGLPLIAFAAGTYVVFARALVSRTDHFIGDALAAFSRELAAERRVAPTTVGAIHATIDEVRFRDLRIVVTDAAGRLVAASPPPEAPAASAAGLAPLDPSRVVAALGATPPAATVVLTIPDDAGGYRVHARPAVVGAESIRLAGAYPLHDIADVLASLREAFLVAIPLILVGAAAGGYFLAKRSLSPVSAMASRAAEISASTLHERLPVASAHDELGGLAMVVNDLLDRLERAFSQQRRFMADASHELRTPAAILRTEADVTLSREHRAEGEYRESMTVMQDAARRLTRIVDDLFLLARADAGHLVVRHDELYLDEIVHGAVRAIRPLAEQRGVRVELRALADAPLSGDADLLGRLLLNLLDNAIKHSPEGGTIDVALRERDGGYEVSVVDAGPGIPADARERIFERFFRADVARSRVEATATSGAGLGLPIAQHVAEAHGGRLELIESRPGRTEFRVTLPARAGAATRD